MIKGYRQRRCRLYRARNGVLPSGKNKEHSVKVKSGKVKRKSEEILCHARNLLLMDVEVTG